MKIATHVLLFGQDKWIMKNIENSYPHVDKIYVSHSVEPWIYNSSARNQYTDNFDLNIILESKFNDKVELILGKWDTEEEQRNSCVDAANRDGMDYLIIHDADEFYFHDQFKKIINYIKENPDYDYYKIAWYCFWKSFNYILLDADGHQIAGYPEFAINLKRGVRFESKRRPNKRNNILTITESTGICYHGSYVLTNEELLQKINTWGHTNDFNKEFWYSEKWLKWTPDMINLHLVSPSAWSKAVNFNYELPEVIKNMNI
jgi:hypothetical protein